MNEKINQVQTQYADETDLIKGATRGQSTHTPAQEPEPKTLEEKILHRFFIRQDAYGKYWDKKPGQKASHSWIHKGLPQSYEPLTEEIIKRHTLGNSSPMGPATTNEAGLCKWLCFDMDCHQEKDEWLKSGDMSSLIKAKNSLYERAVAITQQLQELKIDYMLEDSTGGYHIWVFLPKPIQAAIARLFANSLTGLEVIEIFPKQDKPNKGGFGNFVRLPGRYHSLPKGATGYEFSKIWHDGQWHSTKGMATWELIASWPTVSPEVMKEIVREAEPVELPMTPAEKKATTGYNRRENSEALNDIILTVLEKTPGVCDSYDDFLRLVFAFKSANYSYDEVDCIFRNSANYNYEENLRIYEKAQPHTTTMGTAFYFAQQKNKALLDSHLKARRSPGKLAQWKNREKAAKSTIETGTVGEIERRLQGEGMSFVVTQRGIFWEKIVVNPFTQETLLEYQQILYQKVQVLDVLQDISTGETSVLLTWPGISKPVEVPLRAVSLTEHLKILVNLGLRVNSLNSKLAIAYFAAALKDCQKEKMAASKNGWIDKDSFIYGNKVVTAKTTSDIFFTGTSYLAEQAGSKEAWLEIANRYQDDIIAKIAMGGAAISPLLKLIGAPSFIVHFSGGQKTGKTFIQYLAASIYGNPRKLVEAWDQTRVGRETYFEEAGSLPCFLNEAHQAKEEDIGKTCYEFANERGRGRGTMHNGETKRAKSKEWFGVLLSSGEQQIGQASVLGGIQARIVEIQRSVVTKEILGQMSLDYGFLELNHGLLGQEIIQYALRNRNSLSETYRLYLEHLLNKAQENSIATTKASHYAAITVGGDILNALGIPGFGDILVSLEELLRQEEVKETWEKALDFIRDLAITNQNFFGKKEGGRWKWPENTKIFGTMEENFVNFIPTTLRDQLKQAGYPEAVLNTLLEKGYIIPGQDGKKESSQWCKEEGETKAKTQKLIRVSLEE